MWSVASLTRGKVVALVVAGAVAGGVGGVVVSQLGVAGATANPDRVRGPHPGLMMRGPAGFAGRMLHGEATIAVPGGRTQVVRMQNGAITAVGGSSVTVRSTDGFTATYTVDKTTRIALNGVNGALTSLKKGDTIRVFGVVDGSTVHARAVLDGLPDQVGPFARWRHEVHPAVPPASWQVG